MYVLERLATRGGNSIRRCAEGKTGTGCAFEQKYGGVVKLHSVRGKRVDGSRETERVKEGGRQTEEGDGKFYKL